MKRPGKKVATDRSFVVALSRGLDVLRAFRPNDGLLGNQEIAARTNLPKPTVSRLTYTLTKLGYLTPVPRFEKYQLAPSAMSLGYAALANLGVRHLSEAYREEVMRETGGAVAVGGRDRLSMIYFGQSRNGLTLGVQLDVGSRIPIATTAMGRAYIWALPSDERAALLRELREHYGSRWPRMRDGIERAGETVAQLGFTISAGEWQNDVHAVGVALKLNDGTGPYAFNCGAPAFRFTEDRLRSDIGPRLVAMVRNIEAALGGAGATIKKRRKQKDESRRESCTCGRGDQVAFIVDDRRPARTVLRSNESAGPRRMTQAQLAQEQCPLLAVRDVSVVFGGIIALNGVSFDMHQGQILGLIGPNGAGKTTLFNCLSRLYQPSSGDILMEGVSILKRPPHRIAEIGIGRTFQNVALFPNLSVLDNVRIGTHARTNSDIVSDSLKLRLGPPRRSRTQQARP